MEAQVRMQNKEELYRLRRQAMGSPGLSMPLLSRGTLPMPLLRFPLGTFAICNLLLSSMQRLRPHADHMSRFVTGFCDSHQTSNYKQTMYEVAARIGMPVTFVDLRHECAHADPPSRQRLERSVDQALEWMWEIYWSGLDEFGSDEAASSGSEPDRDFNNDEAGNGMLEIGSADDAAKKQFLQDSMRAVLMRYLNTSKDVVNATRDSTRSETRRPAAQVAAPIYKRLLRLCGCKRSRWRILHLVLVEIRLTVLSANRYVNTVPSK